MPALIKGVYGAFARGDVAQAFAAFTEYILWLVPGRGLLSRDYRGHADVVGFFQKFRELSAGTFKVQIEDVLSKGIGS